MLFNSFGFLFLYLPLTLAGFFLAAKLGARAAAAWLALASLLFYAWWDARFLPLLLGSILFNYWAGRALIGLHGAARGRCLVVAVGLNLCLLAWFKYANFFAASMHAHLAWHIVLPIGISFFTFTQIAFLVDSYQDKVREVRFIHYVLFVSYFPHLVAGPVLHHREMMPQFADPATCRASSANFAVGLSIFVVGLAKKVLIADNLAPLVAPVFAPGAHAPLLDAWAGVLAYAFQLYFDFSGYSDMAIGLSRLFGVKLPLNFDSPYKAADIAQFWRRWHMTLSRFLRDYLYLPLGGNRDGVARRVRNLMLTMLLGGLWHGAAWTFVAWGGLHGLYLVAHQGWRAWLDGAAFRASRWWRLVAGATTFLAVTFAWVFFRADDFGVARDVLAGLCGANGIALPHGLAAWGGAIRAFAPSASFGGLRWIDFGSAGPSALATAALLAFFAPNTQQIFRHFEPAIEKILQPGGKILPAWAPSGGWSLTFVALFVVCLFSMNRVSEFLYFQF